MARVKFDVVLDSCDISKHILILIEDWQCMKFQNFVPLVVAVWVKIENYQMPI